MWTYAVGYLMDVFYKLSCKGRATDKIFGYLL